MKNILITTSSFGSFDTSPLETLRDNGFNPILNPYKRKVEARELEALIKEYNPIGLIAGTENINSSLLEISELKCISRVGVGWESIDHAAAKENSISVCRTPDAVTAAVAELTLGLILNLVREISLQSQELKEKKWEKKMGLLLEGKTVGIFGTGRIGKRVAELLSAFGCHILCCDIHHDDSWAKELNITYLPSIEELMKKSNIVSIHATYDETLRHLINKKLLNSTPDNFFLINVSRGDFVNEDDLFNALENNIIRGAALDVFENEPYQGKLTELPNIILTPHIGSYALETRVRMEKEAVENLLKSVL